MKKSSFLNKERKTNLKTLIKAAKNDGLALLECTDAKTGKQVSVICAIYRDQDRYINLVPLAKQFDGNPYDELIPPKA
jgi:hypothetical protein